MPTFLNEDFQINYAVDGPAGAPTLVLSNSLGTELDMWEPQMPALTQHFRVIRHDARGHGETDVTPGPYSIAQLGGDVLSLMDHLDIQTTHFMGLSMGGMIGMWLAIHHPQRVRRLVLANTAAQIGSAQSWNLRIEIVNSSGMPSIAQTVLDRWFTADYQERAPEVIEKVRTMLLRTASTGYTASSAAVRDMDQREQVGTIKAPTLVIAGTHDESTPAENGRFLAESIPGARYVELDAAHLSNWQQAQQFTENVLGFLQEK